MKTILVIDDDSQLCGILCSALQSRGFRALGAENAATGIQLAREHKPCIIVSDILMPDGDGYEVITSLSDNEMTSSIPVILMTGHPKNAGVNLGLQLGADACLFKPFTTDDLLSTAETSFLKRASKVQA